MDKLRRLIEFVNEMRRRYKEHHITAFSAQMSYFFILSLFPFLIFLVALIGWFSLDNIWVIANLSNVIPKEAAQIVLDYVQELAESNTSIISVSIIATLWTASKAINALMRALNIVYEVKETRGYFVIRFLGMFYTIMFAFAIILALVLPSMGKGFFDFILVYVHIPQGFIDLFTSFRWVGVLAFLGFVLGSTHVVLPNTKISIRTALPGTALSLMGWVVTSLGFSYFVQNFGRFTIIYGSLTAVIILMIWMYMSSVILMFGGEINHYILEREDRKKK